MSVVPARVGLFLALGAVGCLFALACSGGEPVAGRAADGLVFVRVVEGSGDLLRVRISDGAERSLIRTPDREEAWPYWSEAARLLVFEASDRGETQTHDLRLWSPETGGERPVFDTPARREGWAAWSPSGQALVFAYRIPGGPTGVGLVETKAGEASGGVRVLARADADQSFLRPQVAPDGRRVLAQRRGDGGRGSHLWILASGRRGPRPRPLTRDPAWYDLKAWFTRDGSQVVYSRRPAVGGPYEVVVMRADGTQARRLELPGDEQHSARPSPTRDEIAFVAARGGHFDLFLADLSGDHARPLTDTPDVSEFAPRWSPDGERLVVTVGAEDEDRPRLTDRAGLEETRIRVFDREGHELLDVPGMMADWMPPWP